MKRIVVVVALVAIAATPAAAQFYGMPMWNSPKGGTGITISGDFGAPNADYDTSLGAGKGTAFGGRASLGLANLTITAGVSSYKPEAAGEAYTSFGGNAAFRIIGGSLLPVALNLQLGAARINEANTIPAATRFFVGAGVSASLPTPGVSVEPYLSLSNRWRASSGLDVESNFGWTLGANLGFGGMFGIHAAYDSESQPGATGGIIGVGAHVQLRVPMGL
ncbi:MAG TPA: hypothetical protein VGA20_07320 [Gemmatimonadales bacterium]